MQPLEGRKINGHFVKGNKIGRGDPHFARVQGVRTTIFNATSEEEVREIWGQLISKAKAGNLAAIREVLDRLLGKPRQDIGVGGEDGGPLQVQAVKGYMRSILENPKVFEAAQSLTQQIEQHGQKQVEQKSDECVGP